jgi:tetratricopeptide (TPR) repeat protein
MSLRITITAIAFTAVQFVASSDAFAKNPPPRGGQSAEPQLATETAEYLLNEGFANYEAGLVEDAAAALAQVLELPGATDSQIVEARLGLAVMAEASGQAESAIDHLNSLLQISNVTLEYEVAAHVMRGRLLMTIGSTEAANDFTAVIENPNADIISVEDALLWRALIRGAFSDWDGVIADADRVLLTNVSRPDVTAAALAMRGMANKALGNTSEAAMELMTAYRMLDLPYDMVQPVANALIEMGIDPDAQLHRT